MIRRFGRTQHAGAALLLFAVLNVLFFPYLWGNMSLLSGAHDVPSVTNLGGPGGDPARPFSVAKWKLLDPNGSGAIDEPTFALVHHQLFVDHELPLWNPDMAFGTPLAAAMQQQPFYPLTAIVMLHPSPTTFAAYIVLRLLVAGFATYLFMRFFVTFWPAVVAGIAFMLSGYFIHYSTMPHLSVETLTGALFLGVEWVLRRKVLWLAVPFLALVAACDLLGGMPESSFVTIVFAASFGLFRILTVPGYRRAWSAQAGNLTLALVCGFACAAFLLLPFAEFLAHSFNVHEVAKNGGVISGAIADMSPRTSLALYLMPLVFGPPWQAGISPNDGYFGIAVAFFAILAVASAAFAGRSALRAPICYFAACAALLIAKRYGVPAVNWVGYLPIVRVITLVKYEECATAFALAALAGFGVHAMLENRRGARVGGLVACAATLALLQAAYGVVSAPDVHAAGIHAQLYLRFAVFGAVAAFLASAAIIALAFSKRVRNRPNVAGALAACLVTAELGLCYFAPMYYVVDPGPPKRQNPYAGAPYIRYLHDNTRDGSRIYAEKTGELNADWSQAFDLKDVRDIDAMYDARYFPFGKAFLPKDDTTDLVADFSGSGLYTMAAAPGRRFLSLASVRYVVADNMVDPASLLGQIRSALPSEGSRSGVTLQPCGDAHRLVECLAQREPGGPLRVRVALPAGTQSIAFFASLPDVRGGAPHVRSTDFTLTLTDGYGARRAVLRQRVAASGRGGVRSPERTLDVRRYAGTTIGLTFAVRRAGAGRDAAAGSWGDVRTLPQAPPERPFAIRRVDDVNLFEFARPLPHASLYDNVVISPSDAATLTSLADLNFDVFRHAIVSADSIPADLRPSVTALAEQAPSAVRTATIETYTATHAAYRVRASGPALFLLNDTFYPGWRATVDAQPVPILRANYLFRGVLVGRGTHLVDFRYDPLSFKLGLAFAVGGLLGLATFAFTMKRRERRGATAA